MRVEFSQTTHKQIERNHVRVISIEGEVSFSLPVSRYVIRSWIVCVVISLDCRLCLFCSSALQLLGIAGGKEEKLRDWWALERGSRAGPGNGRVYRLLGLRR